MRLLISFALIAYAAVLPAQAAGTVSPGMTRAKVVAAIGAPTTERTVGEFRYLFYANACGKQCGMNDLVVLRNDSVVDAIFRSSTRRYSGTSSSPAPISAKDAADRAPSSGAPSKAPSRGAIRMKPPAEANDARPSIPTNRPTLGPAPTTQPATRTP
jgi:hypothetical protein